MSKFTLKNKKILKMGIFKKLFGNSIEKGSSKYHINKHEDNAPSTKVEIKSEKPEPKQLNNLNMTSWENFFGINLKKSPNEDWTFIETERNNNNTIKSFENCKFNDTYFSYVKALVIDTIATNFFFKCPYSKNDAFDIYFIIERDLVHKGNYTNTAAANKFRGHFDSKYDSFDWEIDGCNIIMSRDIDTGDIELGVWTNFLNKDYLSTSIEEECTQIQKHDTEFKDNDIPLSQEKFSIHLSGALETLNFAHDYIEKKLEGITSCYIARTKGNTVQLLEKNSFDEVYSFRSNEIANFLNGRMAALSFTNFNCDDLKDIKADLLVVPIGESEEAQTETFVHYEMDYLVDPVKIDCCRKTIIDGILNFSIVGIRYRDDYEKLMKTLEEGMTIVLKPEPTNEFDPNALAFYYNGEIIGYLPKKEQPFAHVFMAKGQIEATICKIDEKWIDTEVIITKDMIDFNAYEKNGVHFTKIESFKGGNQSLKYIELKEFIEAI